MAVVNRRKKEKKNSGIFEGLKKEVIGISLIALSVLMWWNIFFQPDGAIGVIINQVITTTFGSLAGFFPVILLYSAFSQLLKGYWKQPRGRIEAIFVLYLAVLGLAHLLLPTPTQPGIVPWNDLLEFASNGLGGGYFGAIVTGMFWWAVGKTGAYILVVLTILISLIVIGRQPLVNRVRFLLIYFFSSKKKSANTKRASKENEAKNRGFFKRKDKKDYSEDRTESNVDIQLKKEMSKVAPDNNNSPKTKNKETTAITELSHNLQKADGENYQTQKGRPTIDILNEPSRSTSPKQEDRSELLAETLASFGVETTITGYTFGPTLTRYEVIPGQGVKVKQIENLADDIALALAARSVRIEAPIPGKRAVGIEIPNEVPGTVYLKEVLDSPSFLKSNSPLSIGIGKDIGGASVVTDLKKLIHLLVAGSTGSGKSVCINTMLASLLIKADPQQLRLLLIDPKRVELALYEDIPHLLTPVVTDPREAAKALRWAVMEMEERYLAFEEVRVRDLAGYNEKAQNEGREILPHIVIVIDELADLMMVASAEVEEAICRLAQKARAAGMHLIVATQRPSTDVVTGLIKANIPSRIAFAVSSGTDSSIILDTRGAEKLLGKGDMLFYPIGLAKPIRLQGAFVSDKEVERIVECWKAQADPDYIDLKVEEESMKVAYEAKDELLPQAAKIIVENDRASASFLQRHLRIGYTRAARLIDIMETMGIVGEHQGSKPREILVNESQLQELLKDY